jgi:signal transduction histidine kinase
MRPYGVHLIGELNGSRYIETSNIYPIPRVIFSGSMLDSIQNMKFKLAALSRRYVAELRKHLQPGSKTGMQPAVGLGHRAVALGLETLELARIHEQALTTLKLTASRAPQIKRAEIFFTEAIAPIVDTHRAARQSRRELNTLNARLKRRTTELADTNRRLKEGIVRRKSVEASLKKSGEHYTNLLKDSISLQEELRRMTRQVLAAQEEERKSISRELQNEIAQTLLGINVRLVALKRGARANSKGLKNEITTTQRLVGKTVLSTRRAARQIGHA